ncbi:MAG TPA: hypothetical protein VGD07_09610 [Methylomirabilota bacterium]
MTRQYRRACAGGAGASLGSRSGAASLSSHHRLSRCLNSAIS